MTDQDRNTIATLWNEETFREALTRFFEDQSRSTVAEIRSAIVANDIVRAAINEGKLQILQALPTELKGVTRTGSA
jgi:hypothetical protein